MQWATADAADVEAQRQRIAASQEQWGAGDHRYLMRADGDVLVGGCGLHRRVGPGGIEIGYWVHVDHTGRGYATAAARALTEAAFDLPDIDKAEIHCDLANVRSQAVPLRLRYRLDRIDACETVAPAEVGKRMIWIMNRSGAEEDGSGPRSQSSR
jgi:RimJ/RimL family protein N-acetyltransferase